MKKLLLTSSLFICLIATQAQTTAPEPQPEEEDKEIRVSGQIGINVTEFLKQFVVFNDNTIPVQSPFDFNGKAFVTWNRFPTLSVGPRVGFGYRSTHEYSNNALQTNERSTDTKSRSARVGLELQQTLSKRWTVYYGFDYINAVLNTSTVSVATISNPTPPFGPLNVRTVNSTYDKTTGFGPILGIQFNINRHICLGTETSFYYQKNKGGIKTESTNPNNNLTETFTDATVTTFLLPFFINCNIVF